MSSRSQESGAVIKIIDPTGAADRAQTLILLQRLERKVRRMKAHIKRLNKRLNAQELRNEDLQH